MLLPLAEYLAHEIAEAGLMLAIACDPVAGFNIPRRCFATVRKMLRLHRTRRQV
jgi:hypothetical protein